MDIMYMHESASEQPALVVILVIMDIMYMERPSWNLTL